MTEQAELPEARRWAIIAVVMVATLMQVLDSTIANVALPHMQAALGAAPDTISWVLTSYIIMSAVATPVTGWLESRLSRRVLFSASIVGFTIASIACGAAGSIGEMVAARAVQGICGAFIGPLGQATLLDTSPREKHPQVMMIWAMGIMIGPIAGPILGGWLTDNWGWRWVFFINVPIGIVVAPALWLLLKGQASASPRRFDVIGFAILASALSALQLMLDRGAQLDWFQSSEIIIEAGVCIAAFWMFVIHTLTTKTPLLPRALFHDVNFLMAVIFTLLITGISMSGSALMAPMLQQLFGYDAMGAGMLMVPRSIGALIAMPTATYLSRKVDLRLLIAGGLVLTAFGLWQMTFFNLEMGQQTIIYAGLVSGFGMGMAFLPLNNLAFSTLAPALRTEAASFYGLARNIGSSLMISAMSVLLTRNTQISHSDLASTLDGNSMIGAAGRLIGDLGTQAGTLIAMINGEVSRQALMIAYIDDYWLMQWIAIGLLPLIIFMRRGRPPAGDAPAVME